MISGLLILNSCNSLTDDTPKCDAELVKKDVLNILDQNKMRLIDKFGTTGRIAPYFNAKGDGKIVNIITKSIDKEIKLCNCESLYEDERVKGQVTYIAQKNSEGDVIIRIENAGPFLVY